MHLCCGATEPIEADAAPEGRSAADPRNVLTFERHSVNPGGLGSLGIRILHGRDFAEHDTDGTPMVAVISQGLADTWWPGGLRKSASGWHWAVSPAMCWRSSCADALSVTFRPRVRYSWRPPAHPRNNEPAVWRQHGRSFRLHYNFGPPGGRGRPGLLDSGPPCRSDRPRSRVEIRVGPACVRSS